MRAAEHIVELTEGELAQMLRRAFSMEQYLTVAGAAEYCCTRKATVYGWISDGLIHAYRPKGSKTILKKADLDGLVSASRIDPTEMRRTKKKGQE